MIQGLNEIKGLIYTPGSFGKSAAPLSPNEASQYSEPQDKVTLSKEARDKSKDKGPVTEEKDLDSGEKQQVNQLKKRDAEVKAHEAAHMAAGGAVVQGGASYQYQRGPDGKTYAVGGEVKIDMSPEQTPEGTIRKMQQVKQAALAPAQPSGTDRAVAARAAQTEAKARTERTQELNQPEKDDPTAAPKQADNTISSPTDDSSNPVAAGNNAQTNRINDSISAYHTQRASASPIAETTGNRINLSV